MTLLPSRASAGSVTPAIGSEWISCREPDRGIYRVLEIRPARRSRRGHSLVGPDAICERNGRRVVVPVRAFDYDGPFQRHEQAEAV